MTDITTVRSGLADLVVLRIVIVIGICLGCSISVTVSATAADLWGDVDPAQQQRRSRKKQDGEQVDHEVDAMINEVDERPKRTPKRSAHRNTDHAGLNGRAGHLAFKTFGRNDSITAVELFPYLLADDHLIFGDMRGFVSNIGQFGGNVGVGYRYWVDDWERVLGASFWYDADDTTKQLYHQLGLSLETYGRMWDFRTNLYWPIGDTEKIFNVEAKNLRFAGNQLVFDRHQETGEAMPGLDLELGFLLPWEFTREHNMRVYGGWYHFVGDAVPDIDGFRVRGEAELVRNVTTHVELTDDDTFGTNVMLAFSIGFNTNTKKRVLNRTSKLELMRRYVQRNYNIIVTNEELMMPDQVAINPLTGTPFEIQHVSSGSAGLAGTADDPVNTLAAAQALNPDIIFVHAGSVLNETVALQPGQMLLGEGGAYRVAMSGFSPVRLPSLSGMTEAPIIQNAAGTAITLASNSTVSGLVIDSPTGHGIVGNHVSNVTVQDVQVLDAQGDGFSFQNASGDIVLNNIEVLDALGAGLAIDGGTAHFDISGLLDNSGGRLLDVQNTTSGDIDLTDAELREDGGTGIFVSNANTNIDFGVVNIQNSASTGIQIENSTGDFVFNGSTIVNQPTGNAVDLQNITGRVAFNDLQVATSGPTALFVRAADAVSVAAGFLDASGGGAAADIEAAALDIRLTSIFADGGAYGLRIIDSTGTFAVFGDGAVGTGGLIQNADTGIVLDNSGTAAFQYLDLDSNGTALQADGVEWLSFNRSRITNSTGLGLDLMNVKRLEVTNSSFTGNVGVSLRARVDTTDSYNYTIEGNGFSDDFTNAIEIGTLAGGAGSNLTMLINENAIINHGNNTDGLNIAWNGDILGNILNNAIGGTGTSLDGIDFTASSTTDLSMVNLGFNTFQFERADSTGLRLTTHGPTQFAVGSNIIRFDAASGTGLNFTLAESAEVNIFDNAIIDNVSSGTGIEFNNVDGPAFISINNNEILLLNAGASVDRGINFSTITDTVFLSGSQSNTIIGASTNFFAPLGTTSGSIIINGGLVP